MRPTDDERPAGKPIEIERVRRLTELEHHVIGDVDNVVDRAYPGGFEPPGQPRWRRSHRDFEYLRTVPRAEIGILDRDGERRGAVRHRFHIGRPERRVPDDCCFARDSDMTQAIRAVGGDLEVDDAIFDRGHFESAQGDLTRHGLDVGGDLDELRQPGVNDLHSGNCSRNRRSFS